jgi:glyoxylate/hydroxypyruvate reductase A
MKSLLVAAPQNAEVWAEHFRRELPGHRILVAPPEPGTPVAYIAVGRPPPGLIASLTGLEVVLSLNAGIEPLLLPGVVAESIPIVRMVDDGLTEGMLDWVLAQVLAWHRELFAYADSQKAGLWEPRPVRLARERVVTVLGAGALGRPVAEMLRSFGFQVRVWSRSPRPIPGVDSFAGAEGFGAALDGADVLIDLLPLTPDTEGLLDARAFDRLAAGAFVINGGRGGTVVDEELIAALDRGQLSAAALDVFHREPLPAAHPFWSHPGVRVFPHVAAPTQLSTAVVVMAETVRRWERGEPLENLVDRARGY